MAVAQASSRSADLAKATHRTCWTSLWLLLKLKSLKYYLFDMSLEENSASSRANLNIKTIHMRQKEVHVQIDEKLEQHRTFE